MRQRLGAATWTCCRTRSRMPSSLRVWPHGPVTRYCRTQCAKPCCCANEGSDHDLSSWNRPTYYVQAAGYIRCTAEPRGQVKPSRRASAVVGRGRVGDETDWTTKAMKLREKHERAPPLRPTECSAHFKNLWCPHCTGARCSPVARVAGSGQTSGTFLVGIPVPLPEEWAQQRLH